MPWCWVPQLVLRLAVDCTNAEHGYVAHSLSKELAGQGVAVTSGWEEVLDSAGVILR